MLKREALNPKDPELTALAQAVGKYARHVAWFAAERALTSTPVSERPAPSVLEYLRTFQIPEAIRQREALASLVEQLDAAYRAASDADPPDEQAVAAAFRRARAANSLLAALEPNEVQAVVDTVYETYHSLPDDEADSFITEVKEKLRCYATLP